MSKKPPIPEKSDRIKNLPVPRPRNAGPPPKPPPYNNHRKVLKKPDPAPRRINRQQIEAPLAATPPNNHLPGTSPVEDASLSPDTGGQNFTPPSPRGEYSGGSAQRPRLDTPVTPPDPASIPPTQNGVLSPPVPLVRSGAAAAALSKAHTPLADDSGDRKLITPNVGSKCTGKSPLPTPQDSRECANSVTSQELQYAEAYGVSDKADNADKNLYSTVSDSPRRFITPPPSDPPPPAPLSHSVAPPPVPLPRSSAVTHPLPPLPVTGTSESEYNVTSHVARKAEACGKQPTPPPPTPPDTYSALARPDQPQKSLNPVPPDSLSQTYSSLDQDGIHQPAPVVKPVEQDERYSHLEFNGVTGHDIVLEHYEMSAGFRGGRQQSNIRQGAEMGIYEVVSPQDEGLLAPIVDHSHRPLSSTRSAPLETKPRREKPKVVARLTSQKSVESLSHEHGSVEHRENLEEKESCGVTDKVVSSVKPTPAPKSWKTMQPSEEDVTSYDAVSEEQGGSEEEGLYCIPPEASTTPDPSPSLPLEEVATAVEVAALESAPPLISSGWGTESEREATESLDDRLQKPDTVEDGRASSSSLVRDCFAELAKLHCNSPTHVLINVDKMRDREKMDEGENESTNGREEEEEEEEEEKTRRHSYENQEIVLQQTKERETVAEERETEPPVVTTESAGETSEDLSQYDMQTVRKRVVPDAQGYCDVELNKTRDHSPSLVDEIMSAIENRSNGMSTEEGQPLQLVDDDITNYDMQTVSHPPVTTNAQGYSYCDVGLRSPSEMTSGGSSVQASSSNSAQNDSTSVAGTATGDSAESAPFPPGYSEIDVLGVQSVPLSREQQPGTNRPPEPAPKPQRRPNATKTSNGAASFTYPDPATVEGDTCTSEEPHVRDGRDAGLSDNDSLYAQVMDVKKEETKSIDSSPSKLSKQKKQAPPAGHGRRTKGNAPRRRPPPPPPVGTIPGNFPLTSAPCDVLLIPQSAPCLRKSSPLTETLPPLPPTSHRPPLPGSPSHLHLHPNLTDDGAFTASLPASSLQTASPKLSKRKGGLPSAPSQTDPPSPAQKRGIFSRVKSSSLKSRKSDNNNSSHVPVSPLTDEGARKGEHSPKLGWKKIFRRGSGGNSATPGNEGEGDGNEMGVVGSSGSESRKRRSREDKLPEVPMAVKSMSLPSPARNLGGAVSGVHLHPYNGEEEEEEDDLYSVVNKPEKSQPRARVVKADARNNENADAASKAYEVIIPRPSLVRARTGSRGKNDVIKKSNSVEHLESENDPGFRGDKEEEREVGSRSATSSPVLQRHRPADDANGDSPEHGPSERLPAAPPPAMRHVYAIVSKEQDSADGSPSRGAPPSPLPKPRRGGASVKNRSKETVSSNSECSAAVVEIPRLEVFEPLESTPSSAPPLALDDTSHSLEPTGDKRRDEDTVSLQGIPSSEITHEQTESGQIYAVVHKKSKKKKKKVDPVGTPEGAQESGSALDGGTVPISSADQENGAGIRVPKQKPPVKPPRMKPPKPAPYFARPGSPIPALLAAERSSPVPPPSPSTPSPPIPEYILAANQQSAEEATGTGSAGRVMTAGLPPPPDVPPPPSKHTASTTDMERVRKVSLDVEQQRARLSVVGPPSFPPPPPPKGVSSPPPGDHMYETPPALVKTNSAHDSAQNRAVKENVQPPTNDKLDDDWTPGYAVVSKPKNGKSTKNSAAKQRVKENVQPPTNNDKLHDDWTPGYAVVSKPKNGKSTKNSAAKQRVKENVQPPTNNDKLDDDWTPGYAVVSKPKNGKSTKNSAAKQRVKENVQPPTNNDKLDDDWTPGYDVVSKPKNGKSTKNSAAKQRVKENVQPPTNNDKLDDDWTPGYDVVSKPKNGKSTKNSTAKLTKQSLPTHQSLPEHSLPEGADQQPSSPLAGLYKDERAKFSRSTVTPRSAHLYEAVSDEVLESNRAAEAARPASIAVPRRSHIYETPSEVRKKMRRNTPKKRPPPSPPTHKTKPDNNVPIVATAPDKDSNGHPKTDPHSALSTPVSEIVSNPISYLGPDLAGKRLTVDIQYNEGEDEERESNEPIFLFNKGHSSSFIRVGGQELPESSVLSPVHSVNTQSSSSVSVYEDDSDADIMYSTEWESSSGEEDEEEEEYEEEGEEGRVIQHKPARTKTFYIAQEILTTERTYVKGLRLIDRDFRSAITSSNRAHDKPVVSEETLKLILGNVGSILSLNSGMLTELEERMKIWDSDPRIGDIILNRAPYLKIYSEFISRFDKALKTLEETTKKNPQFARVLREFEAQPACAQLPLAGYMLEIVQRIPRYKLLLTDYVKHLPENSPDRTPSEKSLDIISSVATHVNETIRQMDNFRKVMEVRKKLIGDTGDTLITPYRKLLKEGMLLKFSRKEPQPRMFFLFNDILIYSSSIPPTNTTFKVIKRIPLEGMRMEMLNDPDMRHGFQIISTCKSFRLEASSNEELHQWMVAFDTAIREHKEKMLSRKSIRQQMNPEGDEESERIPLGHLAPPWLPDSAVSMCQLCSVQFTVTRRRHHCRACGQIFCSDCSSYLAPLHYKSDKLGRVCQSCYESIIGAADVGGDGTLKRGITRSVKSQKINLPSVLREMKARDQNAQISGYLLSHTVKSRRWKKKWFIVYNLVLYEFEKHEDVTAKSSVALPSYQICTARQHDPLVFCLKHPGTGKLYFKTDTEEQRDRWLEILEKAVKGEIFSQQEQHLSHRAPSPQPDNDSSP